MKDGSGIVAVIETVKGTIRLTLFDQRVPVTTGNFVNLARRGYYDGLTFHRVIPRRRYIGVSEDHRTLY